MRESRIPSDEQLLKEIRSISKCAPHLMVCGNCENYHVANGQCDVLKRTFVPHVRGCEGRHFVTAEELLLAKVKKELQAQSDDLDKIEAMLCLLLATSCAASCFAVDLEKRLKDARKLNPDRKSDFRKDLDMTEQIGDALKRINKITEEMQKEMQKGLDKIDQQYRIYIESHMNKLFKSDGKFDEKKSDANLNNGMTFCNVLGKFVKGCLGNKRNYDLVIDTLDNLINSTPYALGFDDFKRFELKGVE